MGSNFRFTVVKVVIIFLFLFFASACEMEQTKPNTDTNDDQPEDELAVNVESADSEDGGNEEIDEGHVVVATEEQSKAEAETIKRYRFNPYEDDGQETHMLVTLNELPEALENAEPGTTIRVRSGEYKDVKVTLHYHKEGTVAIRAEEPGSVIISGESTITIKDSQHLIWSGFMFDKLESKITIDLNGSHDIHITDNYIYRNGITHGSKLITIRNGSSYNHVHHNTFDDSEGQSIGIYNAASPEDANNKYNEIYNNYFYKVRYVGDIYEGQNNGLETVQIGQGRDTHIKLYTKVYENLFEENIGDRAEIISVKTSNNDIYQNTFLNNESGLTIRLGDSNKIVRNYFKNTEKGLRTYGFDQLIRNNYFEGGNVGIQFPAADTKTKAEPDNPAPYYQTDRIKVLNNTFVNPLGPALLFGKNFNRARNYILFPIDSLYSDNEIYITDLRSRDYDKETSAFTYFDPLVDFQNNQTYLPSADFRGNMRTEDESQIQYHYVENPLIPSPEEALGFIPFQTNDQRVGASWKRPIITEE